MKHLQPNQISVRGLGLAPTHHGGNNMVLAGANRPLSELEDLELRRHRLGELISLELVSPSLSQQIKKAIEQLDQQIIQMKQHSHRIAA